MLSSSLKWKLTAVAISILIIVFTSVINGWFMLSSTPVSILTWLIVSVVAILLFDIIYSRRKKGQ